MAIDTTPSTVATNALNAIPFETLIGGPLNACVEAQAMAAQTSWQFIQEVGLNPPDENGNRTTTQVTFSYQSDGQMVTINVPLIAIVPIPFIAVQECEIDFMANISAESSSISTETTAEEIGGELSGSAKVGWGPFSVETNFSANYSSKKDSTATQESRYSVEYTMNVGVKAGQADMPAGLAAVLNLMNNALAATPADGLLEVDPTVGSLDVDNLAQTQLIAAKGTNPDGLDASDLPVTWTLVDGTDTDINVTAVSGVAEADWASGAITVKTDLSGMAQVMVELTDASIQSTRLTFDVSATMAGVEHTTTVILNVFNVADSPDALPAPSNKFLAGSRKRRLSTEERTEWRRSMRNKKAAPTRVQSIARPGGAAPESNQPK